MTPASTGDTGKDMPRPMLDCGPYANECNLTQGGQYF
eukprot:CAMPEP_0181315996 /NCGR_PEP_ID=MMETSP1101-20121128/15663_1 /TAXON_ID=46948 /ORGANISM="Rhodomonas abbreviata, Strain Caron Lab Isolate" /LENGTH=36 /DNA_ID= /DNA_START= /DNA_END= /DNA_ORIENTATION=